MPNAMESPLLAPRQKDPHDRKPSGPGKILWIFVSVNSADWFSLDAGTIPQESKFILRTYLGLYTALCQPPNNGNNSQSPNFKILIPSSFPEKWNDGPNLSNNTNPWRSADWHCNLQSNDFLHELQNTQLIDTLIGPIGFEYYHTWFADVWTTERRGSTTWSFNFWGTTPQHVCIKFNIYQNTWCEIEECKTTICSLGTQDEISNFCARSAE